MNKIHFIFMQKMKLIFVTVFSMLLLSACTTPTLKTTSEAAYKESLKKIFDAQKNEDQRFEISKAIQCVVLNGDNAHISAGSADAYNIYTGLNFLGGGAGKLMVLDGKNANEIIKMGNEARKKFVLEKLPKDIAHIQGKIDGLEKEKAQSAQIEETKKNAVIANISLQVEQLLALDTNKPMGRVARFLVNFDAVNNGNADITEFRIYCEILDSHNNNNKVKYGEWPIHFNKLYKNSQLLTAKTTQKVTLEIGSSVDFIPYEKDRYTVSAKLQKVTTEQYAGFSTYDAQSLAKLYEEIAALKAELQKYQ